jgi:hypothetical protein
MTCSTNQNTWKMATSVVFTFVVEAGGGNVGKHRQVSRASEIEDPEREEVERHGILPFN